MAGVPPAAGHASRRPRQGKERALMGQAGILGRTKVFPDSFPVSGETREHVFVCGGTSLAALACADEGRDAPGG